MKQTILTTALTLISFLTFAQTYQVTETQMATWSTTAHKWEWTERQSSNLEITVSSGQISLNDQAHSVYTTVSELPSLDNADLSANRWRAYDEKQRLCEIAIVMYKDDYTIAFNVTYDNYIFRYFYKKYSKL